MERASGPWSLGAESECAFSSRRKTRRTIPAATGLRRSPAWVSPGLASRHGRRARAELSPARAQAAIGHGRRRHLARTRRQMEKVRQPLTRPMVTQTQRPDVDEAATDEVDGDLDQTT